jgi:hypothetical protein
VPTPVVRSSLPFVDRRRPVRVAPIEIRAARQV